MSIDLATDVYEEIATMVARSWRALGVPLAVRPIDDTIVDPEALILLTAWLTGPTDARVNSGALVWSIKNHSLVNTVRLDNMADTLPQKMVREFEQFAATINSKVPSGSWRRGAADDVIPYGVPESQPLTQMDAGAPALLRIRLRSLAGANARSEALTALLASPSEQFTAAAVARDAYVAQRHARVALDSLAVGGWVERWQTGREKRYQLSEQSRTVWGNVPTGGGWGERIRGLYSLLESARVIDDRKPLVAMASVLELVEAQSDVFRNNLMQIPDWRNSDSSEGMRQIAAWIRGATRQLVSSS